MHLRSCVHTSSRYFEYLLSAAAQLDNRINYQPVCWKFGQNVLNVCYDNQIIIPHLIQSVIFRFVLFFAGNAETDIR